jgi:hypothetical protein
LREPNDTTATGSPLHAITEEVQMKWLIPAGAVVAAIRLAAPAKANDRTQDEADQGSELARVPADEALTGRPPIARDA